VFTAPPAPFDASSQTTNDGGLPGPLLWTGLVVVAAAAGAGTWLTLRRRRTT